MPDPSQQADTEVVLPEHLISLGQGEWALWREVCLRGAGFPLSQVMDLALPQCAQLADQLLLLYKECVLARDAAVEAIVEALRADRAFADAQRRTLVHAARALRKSRLPASCEFDQQIQAHIEQYHQLSQKYAACLQTFTQVFAQETERQAHTFYQLAGQPRLREAITWQNRQAVQQGIDVLLRHPPGTAYSGTARRRYQTLLASYLQRYCTKNDSIGFFGPFGWARITASGPALTCLPGPDLLARRTVYFESWCIDALAETFSQQESGRLWMVPSLLPHLHLTKNLLLLPFAPPVSLTPRQAAVLAACDGRATAEEIAWRLLQSPSSIFQAREEIYALLVYFQETRRIKWAFEISPEGAHPEQALRRLLERIGDEELRRSYLNRLAQLEQARAQVARATGNAETLNQALNELDRVFVQLTGNAPTRAAGKTYGARTLVYEDCERAAQVQLGPDFVQALDEPLSLLLISARWFTYQSSLLFRQAFSEAYQELQRPGQREVDFASFWLWIQPLLFEDDNPLIPALLPVFQQLWQEALPFSPTARQVHYRSQELLPRVSLLFDAPGPGWKSACYHAPDLLIAAATPEAVQRGEYQIVLGEFHMAMNTLQISACLNQHPQPEQLLQYLEEDLPDPRIVPVFSRKAFPLARIRSAFIREKDIRLLYAADVCAEPQARQWSIADLVVTEIEEKLVVCSRDKTVQFDILEVFAEFLARSVYTLFQPFPRRQHTPRITLDRLVLMRETWCFTPATLAFAQEKDTEQRFLAARAWMQEQQLPRFVFVKVPTEQKPCFVDFASPVSLDIFARLVQQNQSADQEKLSIVLSEMLPGPEASWLQDAAGEHYTSELRFIAVDLLLPDE